MMSNFTKLWSSIITSTIWTEDSDTKVVWITMLALSDSGGYVAGSIPGLAGVARVTIDECERAISKLLAPDKYSRTKEHEGRRIQECDGGWMILNYVKHREAISVEQRRAANRARVKRHRDRKKGIITPHKKHYILSDSNGISQTKSAA